VISRRAAMFGAAATLLLNRLSFVQDEDDTDWRRALRDAINNKSPFTLGRCLPPPDDVSWKEARAILDGAPLSRVNPYAIANYFVSSIPAKYQRAWPEPDPRHCTYANPVVVMFFLATTRQPDGDATPWCSAFVNWCLHRAGVPGTRDAGSQSFAVWGHQVWSKNDGPLPTSARTGDIAVFQDLSDPRFGHVCFFKQISTSRPMSIEVLGGNQLVGKKPNQLHLIDVATFRVDGNLELRSIRTTDGLR
jgi:uncharacterized protein (TIGR02594 family)